MWNYEFHKQPNTVKITHQQLQIEKDKFRVCCAVPAGSSFRRGNQNQLNGLKQLTTQEVLNENDSFQNILILEDYFLKAPHQVFRLR